MSNTRSTKTTKVTRSQPDIKCQYKKQRRLMLIVSIALFIMTFVCNLPASVAQVQIRKKLTLQQREKQILDQILGVSNYDSSIRPMPLPNSTSGETQVDVNLYIRSVSKIDDFNMEYSVQLTMREEWFDDRLRYEQHRNTAPEFPEYLTITDTNRVWMPDIFFINEKQGHLHNIIKPNAYVKIQPNGQVLFSVRISLVLACPMYLHYFPMDTQKCSISMTSYGSPMKDIVFNWKSEEPVQVPDLSLPRFSLEAVRTTKFDRITNTGSYSTIQADFILRRNFSYYMSQMYLPTIMLVIVSQVSFFIDENAVPARTALGITTLLTMATQSASINRSLPPVSYTKAMDIWTGVCLLFVFAALLEFAFVNYTSRMDKRLKKLWQEDHGTAPPQGSSWIARRYPSRSKRIDVISRIVFPVLFIIFNIGYWTVCLSADDYID